MAERDNVGAALLHLFAGFHIGLTPILKLVCVDHKDLVRRTDEKKSTLSDAPIYIMGSKPPSV